MQWFKQSGDNHHRFKTSSTLMISPASAAFVRGMTFAIDPFINGFNLACGMTSRNDVILITIQVIGQDVVLARYNSSITGGITPSSDGGGTSDSARGAGADDVASRRGSGDEMKLTRIPLGSAIGSREEGVSWVHYGNTGYIILGVGAAPPTVLPAHNTTNVVDDTLAITGGQAVAALPPLLLTHAVVQGDWSWIEGGLSYDIRWLLGGRVNCKTCSRLLRYYWLQACIPAADPI
jgi:hypothetical protein